jgi:hypothetical protein
MLNNQMVPDARRSGCLSGSSLASDMSMVSNRYYHEQPTRRDGFCLLQLSQQRSDDVASLENGFGACAPTGAAFLLSPEAGTE